MRNRILSFSLLCLLSCFAALSTAAQPNGWINEFHYDDSGPDIGEFVEIVVPESFVDLANLEIVLYNGSTGMVYNTVAVNTFTEGTTSNGFTVYSAEIAGIQNGSPDGIALCYMGNVITSGTTAQFLSYEGDFTGSGGCADGLMSTDIGIAQSGASEGSSIGLVGTGSTYDDFSWDRFNDDTPGMINAGQTFVGAPPPPSAEVINELLLTEIVVTPTGGEFIEIYNPGMETVDLRNVYLTDATFQGGDVFYYKIVTGTDAGGGGFGDFHARFPEDATIAPGEYQTVALAGADAFFAEYGFLPDYELFEETAEKTNNESVPDMREAFPGSINAQGGLTNGGEVVILYYWDGQSDLVQDLDYALWGDTAEAVDKTGVTIDGPDADNVDSAYLPDTPIASQDIISPDTHPGGESYQRIDLTEGTETQTGGNGLEGDDETSENLSMTWMTAAATPGAPAEDTPPPPADSDIVINEVDADTEGTDSAEFVELYDGGAGNTALDGLVLVFFNGSNNQAYEAFDLDEQTTDADGYFVLCGNAANVANCDLDVDPNTNLVQNGADAVALYQGDAADFPDGTAVTTTNLIDAIVYDTNDSDDADLLVLLNDGQPQVNEDMNGAKDDESLQRFPNGSGGARNTDSYQAFLPTPGRANEMPTAGQVATAVLTNATDGDPLNGTNIFDRDQTGQTVQIVVAGSNDADDPLAQINITVPDEFGAPTGTITLSGPGFGGAMATVDGQVISITGASVTQSNTGTVQIAGLSTPDTGVDTDNNGAYEFTVEAAPDGGVFSPVAEQPTACVVIPVANLRDVDASGVSLDNGTTVAVRITATVGAGVFSQNDLLAYGQDETAGIALFVNDGPTTPFFEGNEYVIKAPVGQFNGLTQLTPGADDFIDLGAAPPAGAQTFTIAQILAAAEGLEGSLVNINNVRITGGTFPGLGESANLTISDGTAEITLRIDGDTDIAGSTRPPGLFNLIGVVGQFDSSSPFDEGYQILPRRIQDIFFGAPGQTTVQFPAASSIILESSLTTVTVQLNNPSATEATTAEVVFVGGTATASDFAELPDVFNLTFAPGATTASFQFFVVPDIRLEGLETATFALQNVQGGNDAVIGLPSSIQFRIQDRTRRPVDRPDVLPIGTARNEANGTEVIVQGIVTRAMGDFVRIQDASGGLTIRQTAGPLNVAVANGTIRPGTELQVTGTLSEFRFLKQINSTDIASFTILSQDNPLPAPQVVTLAEIEANGEAYESELIRVNNLTSSTDDETFQASESYDISDPTLAEGAVELRTPNADDTAIDGEPIPETFLFEGVLSQFDFDSPDAGYQLLPVQADDVRPQEGGGNTPPSAATITTPGDGSTITLEGDGTAAFTFVATASNDPDGDDIAYMFQISTNENFDEVLFEIDAGMENTADLFTISIAALLEAMDVGDGGSMTLYVRAITSDGSDQTVGPVASFTATRGDLDFDITGARTLPLDTPVAFTGIVTRAEGDFLYLQDGNAGITIRQTGGPFNEGVADGSIAPGDELRIVGITSEFGSLRQINTSDLLAFEVLSRDNDLPEPQVVTLEELANNGEAYEGEVVLVVNLMIDTADATFQERTNYTISDPTLSDGSVVLRLPNADDSQVDGTPVPTGTFAFEGVVTQFNFDDPNAGYQLLAIDEDDISTESRVAVEDGETPMRFTVLGNYPNPFNPSTTVRFDLPESASVRVEVYNVTGRKVLETAAKSFSAGTGRSVNVDAKELASGVYLYRVVAESATTTHIGSGRMILVK